MMKLILKILFKTLKVISTILVVLALIIVISQKVTNNKIRLFGYGVYTVVSESMLPEYEIGDMFLAKEVSEDNIKVGDDIVYIGESGSYKDRIITHRIIRIEANKKIVTKGINNSMEDPPIKYNQVYGKVTARFILLSLFSKLMNNNALFYIIIFVPFTILMFLDIRDLCDKKKKKEEDKEQDDVEKDNLEETINNVEVPLVSNTIENIQQNEIVNNTFEDNGEKEE